MLGHLRADRRQLVSLMPHRLPYHRRLLGGQRGLTTPTLPRPVGDDDIHLVGQHQHPLVGRMARLGGPVEGGRDELAELLPGQAQQRQGLLQGLRDGRFRQHGRSLPTGTAGASALSCPCLYLAPPLRGL